jgi:hypothetical protein
MDHHLFSRTLLYAFLGATQYVVVQWERFAAYCIAGLDKAGFQFPTSNVRRTLSHRSRFCYKADSTCRITSIGATHAREKPL